MLKKTVGCVLKRKSSLVIDLTRRGRTDAANDDYYARDDGGDKNGDNNIGVERAGQRCIDNRRGNCNYREYT